MCGRYTLSTNEGFQERYDAYNNPLSLFEPSYNIPPGTINPAVARRSPNGIYLMKWGLVPFWAKDPKIGYKMINARSEEITSKPSFRKPIRSQRCLIPATGFYEWKKVNLEGKEEKYPWYITLIDQVIFSFAGIYDIWLDVEKKEMLTYSIITTTPNKTMSAIHNRMPVILNQKDEEKYLNPVTPLLDIEKLLRPYPDEKMKAYPVSLRVKGKGLVLGEPKSVSSMRIVAIPEFTKKVLVRQKEYSTSPFVFATSKGTPFSPRNIVRHFKATLKKAALPQDTRIHDLRHTFVSILLSKNTPVKDVQVIAGHSDFSTTMDIYGHLMPGAQRQAADKINDFLVA